MKRRRFFAYIASATATTALARVSSAAPAGGRNSEFVDTNVWISPWPTRHTSPDTPAKLVARLRRHGITSAWGGRCEGALHSDIAGANARLADGCAREGGGVLVPFGTVNPTLPDWEDDLRRCHEVHRMGGVRTMPNYHGYTLDDPRFARLVDLCAQRGLLLQISLAVEDDRSQNPLLSAAPVVAAPLADVMEKFPQARVMVLNSGYRVLSGSAPLMQRLVAAGLWFEIATLEGVAGIEALLRKSPAVRLTFGSHVPYFYFEAALLKLQESVLTSEQLAAIRSGNARTALARS